MIKIGSNTGALHTGSVAVPVSAATHGTIVVVAGIDSQDRFGTHTPLNAISGCSDSQGNVYAEVASFTDQIPYPVTISTDGWVYAVIKVFVASGTLNPGDSVNVAGVNDGGVGPSPCAIVFDSAALGGPVSSAATEIWRDTGLSFALRTLPDADALGLSFSATQSGYAGLAVSWPSADLASWIESTHTTSITGALDPTTGWANAQEDYLWVAYQTAVTISAIHLPVQFRAFQGDEEMATGT